MPLDPKKYRVADQPWTYAVLAGLMKKWNYVPVGDHSPNHLLNLEGFLRWDKTGRAEERKKAFIISNPKWRTHGGRDEPVWPAKVIVDAMVAQEVYQRSGSNDEPPTTKQILLTLNNGTGC